MWACRAGCTDRKCGGAARFAAVWLGFFPREEVRKPRKKPAKKTVRKPRTGITGEPCKPTHPHRAATLPAYTYNIHMRIHTHAQIHVYIHVTYTYIHRRIICCVSGPCPSFLILSSSPCMAFNKFPYRQSVTRCRVEPVHVGGRAWR